MFPLAISSCFSPSKFPNIGTVRTCGPRDTSVLHRVSFNTREVLHQTLLDCNCGKWTKAGGVGCSHERKRLWRVCAGTLRVLWISVGLHGAFVGATNRYKW